MGVKDRYEKKLKKDEKDENESGSETTSGGVAERYKKNQYYQTLDIDSVDDNYINTFVSDANNFFVGLNENSHEYDSAKSTLEDLSARYDTIQGWLYKNKSRYDPESYRVITSAFDEYQSGLTRAKDYFSKWETAEDYTKYQQESQKQQEEYNALLNYNPETDAERIKELERELNRFENNPKYRWEHMDRYKAVKDELASIKSYMEQAEEAQLYEQQSAYYSQLPNAPDFAEKSQYVSTYRGGEKFNAWTGIYTDTGYDDITYDAINRNKEARDIQKVNDINTNASLLGLDTSYLYEMTDDEIRLYNSLYDSNDTTASDEYLKFLLSDLTYRQRERQQSQWATWASEEPVRASAASILMAPTKVITALGQYADYMGDGKIDQNAAYNKYSYIPSSIRSQVASNIAASGSWGEVGSWTYQLGMSMGDFLITTAVTGGNEAFSLALMGSGAMADTVIAAKDRGLSDDQAFTLGIVAGAAEIVTEKLSLDALFGGDISKGAMKYILTNALTEGGEEVGSSLINLVADVLVSKDKSEWQMAIQKYLEDNPNASESEAFQKVLGDELMSLGLDFLGGVIMGGTMGSGGAVINTFAQNIQYSKVGKPIMNVDGGVDALLNLANEVAGVSDMPGLSKQIDKVSNKATPRRVGRLYETVTKANNQANAEMNQADIVKSLERKGIDSAKAERIADALVASYNGQELTSKQTRLLKSMKDNQAVQDAISNIVENPQSTMGQRNQKVAKFSTDIALGMLAKEAAKQPQETTGIEAVSKKYGAQAQAMVHTYVTGQDVTKYDKAYQLAYDMGKSGVSLDYVKSSQSVSYLTDTQKELAYEAGVAASKHKTSDSGNMENVNTGDVIIPQGLVQAEDGTYKLAVKDADPISFSEVSYADYNQAIVYDTFANLDKNSGKTSKVIADMNLDSRNKLLDLYDPNVNKDGSKFTKGVLDAYFYGHRGVDMATASKDSPMLAITPEQRAIAWDTGRAAGKQATTEAQSNIDTVYAEAKNILDTESVEKGSYHAILADGIAVKKLNDKQMAVYQYADKIAQSLQTKIRVYKGTTTEHGFYNHATDEIWLNLNAANSSREHIMAFTLAHELVHRAKKGSPAKYQAFVDFLMMEYGKQGSNVEILIAEQIKAAERFNKTVPDSQKVKMTREKALEEVVADSCQRMLLDTNAGEKLAEFGAQSKQNKSFLADLKKWISELMDKLRRYFKDVEPGSLAAMEFAKFDANVKQILANMYVDMSIDAGEKLSTIKAAYGSEFFEKLKGTRDIQYNLAATESHKAKLQKEFSEDSSTDLETINKRYDKIIDIWTRLGGELNSQFLADWNSKVGKDRTFTIFKAQAGYKYNVELSSMCKKGVPLFEAIDTIVKNEVMKELEIDVLGKAEKEILYDILKQHNFEIPCAICYVEQARQREGVIIDAFLNGKVETNAKGDTTKVKLGWNQVLDTIQKEMKANGVSYSFEQVSRDIATEKYTPANLAMDSKTQVAFYAALKKVANQEITRYNKAEGKSRKLLTEVSPEAVKECFKGTLPANLKIFKVLFEEPSSRFKIQKDLLYSSVATQNLSMAHNKLYGLFNSQGGVSGYKTKQGTTIYWGDILGKSWKPDTLRNEGGVRNQSNSDFQMYTLLDQAQMYLDFTAKGYYLQAYTKVLSELKLFGLSRGKINASLIPKVVVHRNADGSVDIEKTMATAGLDENGNPIYDDIEGINHDEAFMLIEDPEYSKSICGICIGYSDAHINKLLDDPRVQQIIGFHDKTDDGSKRYKGARYAKNYNGLNEAVNKEGKTVHIGFNPYVKRAEKKFKFNAETETYEGTVNYNGKTYTADDIPRLATDLYLEMCAKKEYTPAYEDFAGHPNYYKLLADFGLYDSQGHYAPHRKVAYNMPDTVPYLDANGKKQTMSTYDYIKAELTKELTVRDSISEALADTSSEGIIPQFKAAVKKSQAEKSFSLPKTDSDGNQLTAEQQEFFKDSVVRDTNGRLMVMYHGTANGGAFTVFDGDMLGNDTRTTQVGQGFYFTNAKAEAESYTKNVDIYGKVSKGNNPHLHKVYLNITNPFNITADKLDIEKVKSVYLDGTYDYFFNSWIPFYMNKKALNGSMLTKTEVQAMSKSEKVSVYVDYLSEIGTKEVLSNMVRAFPYGKQSQLLASMKNRLGYDGIMEEFKPGQYQYVAFSSEQVKAVDNQNPTTDPDIRYSLPKGDPAPTFYSHMGRVVDGVKQEKLGASSIVSMLRGKGVKAEEIKWSGIEAWLEDKKSVTKAELQEFIAGSMLQIEEETLDNKDRPYTEEQQKRLDEYEAKRDEVAKRIADEWKKITGEDSPIQNAGSGLESAVTNAIIDFNLGKKKAAFEGRLLKKLRKDLMSVIANNDDFGFDSGEDALRSIHRHRKDFVKNYEMSANDKATIAKYCNALNAYNELPNSISDENTDRLRAIAREADPWNRKIMEVKHEHNEEEAKYMTNWSYYKLKGGKNYREMLFRIPGSTYSNDAMHTHWKERKGVLAHARIQDMETFIGKMLFIEEIQSDWHNAGHKEGYHDPEVYDKHTLLQKMENYREEFFSSPTADMVKERIAPVGYDSDGASMILNFLIESPEIMKSTLSMLSRKGASFTDSEVKEISKYARKYEEMYTKMETEPGANTAPDAPLKDTYHEYVMKRLIRMAAEQDYDSIGWTTAETQDERWANDKPHKEGEGKSGFLKGYTIEYDQDIPKFMSKYGKKWDTTVGKTVLNNGTEVWSMAITDSMKDSVLYDGQVMYSLPKASPYSYETLISKPDMVVTTVDGNVPNNRADVVHQAKKNAAKVGKFNPTNGSISVHVDDVNADVLLGTDGLKHGLRRTKDPQNDANYIVTLKAGEIIKNSIKINEATPKKQNSTGTYVLVGIARNTSGDVYIVRSMVNQFNNELSSMDVLYAINAKKELAATKSPRSTAKPLSVTSSTISIADLLDLVNQYFPDILPEEVLKHYGYDARPEGDLGENMLYKLPIGEDTSPRALLANAFEGIVTDDIEKRKLQEYKGKVEMLNAEEQKLREIRAEIKELSFAKGKRDTKKIKDLQFDAIQTENRIATLDKTLLRLEAAAPLQNILQREKKMAYKRAEQKGKEALEAYRKAEKERDDKWHQEVKDRYQASKKKAIETRDKREAREKLQKLVIDTVKWITYPSKTDVKCPDILKQPYADFLNSIDLSSQRLANGGDPTKNDLRLTNAISSLATALEKIMVSQDPGSDPNTTASAVLDSGYLDLPADFVQKLRDMTEEVKEMMGTNEYVVNKMPAEEVRKLSQMIRTLNHAIKEVSTLYANLRFANVESLGDSTMTYIDALGEVEKTGGFKDFVQWDNALPYYAFKRFGEGGESIFEGMMDAQDKLAFLAQKIFDFQEKTWTGKEAKAWSEDTHTIDLPDGETLNLTTADAMSIYCLSRRQQGLQHLLVGGARVIGLQKGSKKAKDSRSLLTVKDIDTIISSLTDRQKQVADTIQEFMSTVCSEWGNEISMKRFLTKEFNEKFYFPIESNDENLSTKDPAAQQSDLFRLLNISATKPIDPRANNEVIIRNIFDVFSGHAADMARLNAYGMPLLDYMKWLNYREKSVNEEGQINVRGVRKSMEKAYGTAARSYVLNLVKDVNGRPSDGGDPNILMKWMRNAKTASVGNSLRVATLQITSYPRAALVLSPKSLSLGLTKVPKIGKAKQYCGIALWKSFGFYDTNISRSIEEQMKGVKDVRQKLIEMSLKGAELGDALTWGALWNACEYEVASTKKYKVGTEEFYQAVGKKLREVVYRTQVVDSTLTRSQIMRSKRGMAQEAAAFMSEPTLSANILMDAGFQFSAEKRKTGSAATAWKNTGSYITRAVAVYSIGQLAAAMLEGLWDSWRDDEDEEFWKKYLSAFTENMVLDLVPFNKIPIVSDVFEAVLAMFNVGFYSSDKMSTTWLTQAVSAVDAWKTVLNGGSSTTTYNALYKTIRAISSFHGVAYSGVMRECVALWNNTAGVYDSTLKIRQYDLSKADLGTELYEAIISGDSRQADSLKAQFEDSKSQSSAIRKALRENDPRINEAAQAQIDGDPSERVRIARQIIADGFLQDDVVAAINAEINALTPDAGSTDTNKAKGFYTTDDFAKEIANGDQASAYAARVDIIDTLKKNGKSEEEAEKSFNSSAKSSLKEQFLAGNISEQQTINALTTYCGQEEDDARSDVQYWAFRQAYPEVFADDQWFDTYYEKVADSGISVDVYMDYRNRVSEITGENKKEKRMAIINSLPISRAQKDALYYAEGWAESKINEAPWH